MQTFTFQKVQYGYWGQTDLCDKSRNLKRIQIKAASRDAALTKLRQRKDYHKHLRNGDTLGWRLIETVDDCL